MTAVTTVVTAYFDVPSKFDGPAYLSWIQNLLGGGLAASVVMYTSSELMPVLQAMAKAPLALTLRAFDFPAHFRKDEGFWREQWAMDPKRDLHTPELYAVWALKTTFLTMTMAENPYKSSVFFWCDAGSFRSLARVKECASFPNPARVADLDPTKVYFTQTLTFSDGEKELEPGTGLPRETTSRATVCAGVFGGHAPAVKAWIAAVADVRARLLALPSPSDPRRFVAIDEHVFAATAVVHPSLVCLVPMPACDNYCMHVFLSTGMTLQRSPGPRGNVLVPVLGLGKAPVPVPSRAPVPTGFHTHMAAMAAVGKLRPTGPRRARTHH